MRHRHVNGQICCRELGREEAERTRAPSSCCCLGDVLWPAGAAQGAAQKKPRQKDSVLVTLYPWTGMAARESLTAMGGLAGPDSLWSLTAESSCSLQSELRPVGPALCSALRRGRNQTSTAIWVSASVCPLSLTSIQRKLCLSFRDVKM